MVKRTSFVLAVAALCAAAFAHNHGPKPQLQLVPQTISTGAVAKWIKVQDHPRNWVLLLAKNVPTSQYEAAIAEITGIAGVPVSDLNSLQWTLISGTPGGGAPRWNLFYGPPNGGVTGYEFLEPTTYDSNNVGFISTSDIQNPTSYVGALPQPGDVIKELQIIVDVQKSIELDNIGIRINGMLTMFSSPGHGKTHGDKDDEKNKDCDDDYDH